MAFTAVVAAAAVAAAAAAAAVAPWPAALSHRGGRHVHGRCQFLEVLDTSVEWQLDKLVSGGDPLLGKEVLSCFLDATQHKFGMELSHLPCSVKLGMADGPWYIWSNHGELW